jgi:uncharacterized protein (TIGR02147 family)
MSDKKNNHPISTINIFEYFDYREYLGDVFCDIKKHRQGFSFRVFSKEAGIHSHNFLPRILQRKRNLTDDFIKLLSEYLQLTTKEEKFFHILAVFNNAKKLLEKEQSLKLMLSMRVTKSEYKIKDKKLLFFGKWYYPVVRELAVLLDFKDDFKLLSRKCIPRITAAQAESATIFLVKNGFLIKNNYGRYETAEPILATEAEVNSAIISRYHKTTLKQCADAVETMKKEERNFTSSTLSISMQMYEEMKMEIFHIRKRFLDMARLCENPEMVCFAGFQLLPRSEIITDRKPAGSKSEKSMQGK